jgi:hypothetical protein
MGRRRSDLPFRGEKCKKEKWRNGKMKTTEYKLEVAQGTINNYSVHMDYLKRQIAMNVRFMNEALEEGKIYGIPNYASNITEYCNELRAYEKMQTEMQDLLDYIKTETE